MKQIRYQPRDHALEIDGGYRASKRRGVLAAPLGWIFDVSLVSFRNAAIKYIEAAGVETLTLGWAVDSVELFEAGSQRLGLHRLVSDGKTVWLCTFLYLAERDGFPEDSDLSASMVSRNLDPIAPKFDGISEVEIGPFVPGALRRVDIRVALPPQRRTIGEANALGDSLRTHASEAGQRFLGSPEGVISALRFAPQALLGQVA